MKVYSAAEEVLKQDADINSPYGCTVLHHVDMVVDTTVSTITEQSLTLNWMDYIEHPSCHSL